MQRSLRTGPVVFAIVALAPSVAAPRAWADLLVLNSAGSSSHIKRFNATTGAAMNTFGYTTEGMYSLTVTLLNEVLTNSNILGGYELYRFNAAGEYRGTLLGGQQAELTAATRGPDGHLYVIWRDYPGETRRIVRVDSPALATLVAAGAGAMAAPSWMGFGPDRNLYVSDAQAGILRFHGTTGASLGVFVAPGSGGLPTGARFVFGPDGHLYVPRSSTNSVLRFAGGSGAWLDEFVAPASGGLINPRAVAFGPDGHLYVTSGGTRQVLRYDGQTGAFLSVAAEVEGAAGDPRINLTDIAFVRTAVAGDMIWFEDAPPAGAVTGTSHGGPWAWATVHPTPIGAHDSTGRQPAADAGVPLRADGQRRGVGAAVSIRALASDHQTLASVSFRIDGNEVALDPISPFAFYWNSATVANGSHAVTADARDSAGDQAASASGIISVNNGGSPATNAVIWREAPCPRTRSPARPVVTRGIGSPRTPRLSPARRCTSRRSSEGDSLERYAGRPHLIFGSRATLADVRQRVKLAYNYLLAVAKTVQRQAEVVAVGETPDVGLALADQPARAAMSEASGLLASRPAFDPDAPAFDPNAPAIIDAEGPKVGVLLSRGGR